MDNVTHIDLETTKYDGLKEAYGTPKTDEKLIEEAVKRYKLNKKPNAVEQRNAQLFLESEGKPFRMYLHPTKGYRKLNKKRESIASATKKVRYKHFLSVLSRSQVKS